jgi:translation initiation factor IF-2
VLKTDVAGSLEAILGALPAEFIVMHAATGEVTENDVILAKDTNAIVVAFNTKVTNSSAKLAEVEKVRIQEFKIIYELLDSVDKLKHPVITEIVLGRAEILKEFDYDGTKIAGCRCTEGVISRSDQVKIMRGDKQVGLVKLKTLQSGKLQVEKIKSGTEFGASFSPSIDFKLQDSIIALKYESH